MSFELRALVAPKKTLEAVAARLPGAKVAELAEGLGLLPLPAALEAALKPEDRKPVLDGLRLGERVSGLAREASKAGPIAYVEADYSAGRDFQGAVLFSGGGVSWGPRCDRAAWDPREPAMTERPVNAALRALGVQRGDYGDEWDAVALARHSTTESW